MYLKRLDIYGFKSFGVRTRLEFVPGIIGVVGPNGSGKSNIADAVRWVLGEQSAKSLRGSKMEDIIFAGSDGKRPLGYAEVSLTLDNSDGYIPLDFSEITITRRVYRSGESQYFINRTHCRLRDVQELFLDTGLGKDTYALIGQGQIDQILNSRPEDKKSMIEEAAGIVKYRRRRAETQRRLEDTQQHLLRVNDIIIEMERQLEPLKKEAEKASTYRKLTDELKAVELSMYSAQMRNLTKEKRAVEESIDQIKVDLALAQEENAKLTADITRQKQLVARVESDVREKEQALNELNHKLITTRHEKSLVLTERKNLQERKDEAARQLSRSQEQISLQNAALSAARIELEKVNKQIVEVETRKKQLEQEIGESIAIIQRREAALASLHKEEKESEQKSVALQQNLLEWKERRQGLLVQKKALCQRLSECEAEIQRSDKDIAGLVADCEQIKRELSFLTNETDRLERELKERQATRDKLKSQHLRLLQTQQTLQSRLKILKEMEAEYEGYSRAVKAIMQSARSGKLIGVIGTVAELLKVPPELICSIETALGSSLQNVVMASREEAEKAINYLKVTGIGRATFLPLDGLWSSPLSEADRERIRNVFGCIGVADELVEYDEAYSSVVRYLLGRVIVTENMKSAIAVSKVTRRFGRIVTKDGDQISPGGAMTGGSTPKRKSTGLLTRRQVMEELVAEIQATQVEIVNQRKRINNLEAEIAQMKEQLAGLQERRHLLDIDLAATERDLANARAVHSRVLSEKKQQEDQLAHVDRQMVCLEKRRITAEQQLSELEEKSANVRAQISELVMEIESFRKEHSQADKQITNCRVRLASLIEKKQSIMDKVDSIEKHLWDLISLHRQQQEEVETIRGRIEMMERKVSDIDQVISQLEKRVETAKSAEGKLKKVVEEHKRRLEVLIEKAKMAKDSAGHLQIRFHEAERRLDKVDLEQKHLLERLFIDYDMSAEQLQSTVSPAIDLTQARRRANILRDQVKAVGTVNLNANDEYAAVKERYDFLIQQREDLVRARQSLQKVIDEMDQVSRERFMSTLARVRKNFQVIFNHLFGGGKCDLILTDDKNLAQTGLEIMAQPPGKKLQALSLLSGGEKTLAALAFLFAMQAERPSPFCVLDEVDAALDDANLARFAQLLRDHVKDTQFLVITHRQETMEQADVLYGVTMNGDGVSKLVSVKLGDQQIESAEAISLN